MKKRKPVHKERRVCIGFFVRIMPEGVWIKVGHQYIMFQSSALDRRYDWEKIKEGHMLLKRPSDTKVNKIVPAYKPLMMPAPPMPKLEPLF